MGNVVLLRTLTRKSKINLGKLKEMTVQEILDMKDHRRLIYYYFKFSKITYIEDILDELKILPKYRFKKPGKNKELYISFMEKFYPFKKLKIKYYKKRKK